MLMVSDNQGKSSCFEYLIFKDKTLFLVFYHHIKLSHKFLGEKDTDLDYKATFLPKAHVV